MNKFMTVLGILILTFAGSSAFSAEKNICEKDPNWAWCKFIPQNARVCEVHFYEHTPNYFSGFMSCDGQKEIPNISGGENSFTQLIASGLSVFRIKGYDLVSCSQYIIGSRVVKSCTLTK